MQIQDIALDNKYTKWYMSIVNRAKARASTRKEAKELLGYVEGHHIMPKSIYRSKDNKDIVYLSLKEHFIVHRLLPKMVTLPLHKQKMSFALASFMRSSNKNARNLSSKQFEIARGAVIDAMTGRTVSEETRAKQSMVRKGRPAHNKGKPGKKTGPCSDSRKANISNGRKKTPKLVCPHCKKETDPGNYKQFHGDNCRYNPNIDAKLLEQRSNKKREATKKAIANGNHTPGTPIRSTVTCPHCGKQGNNIPLMMRWHFDRCKQQAASHTPLQS